VLPMPTVFNPMNELLRWLSELYPASLFAFTGLVVYILVCAIFGVGAHRMMCCGTQLVGLDRKATPRKGLLFLCWQVTLLVVSLYMQMLTVAPYYAVRNHPFRALEHPCTNGSFFLVHTVHSKVYRTLMSGVRRSVLRRCFVGRETRLHTARHQRGRVRDD
jgi:hypothetical protein